MCHTRIHRAAFRENFSAQRSCLFFIAFAKQVGASNRAFACHGLPLPSFVTCHVHPELHVGGMKRFNLPFKAAAEEKGTENTPLDCNTQHLVRMIHWNALFRGLKL
eukprot:scaffold380621_cov32-Prasinocladus_malaysianus.AAC.1